MYKYLQTYIHIYNVCIHTHMYIDVNTFSCIHLAQLTCTLLSFPSGGQAHKDVVRVTLHREVRVQTAAATARDRCECVKRALYLIKRALYCHKPYFLERCACRV